MTAVLAGAPAKTATIRKGQMAVTPTGELADFEYGAFYQNLDGDEVLCAEVCRIFVEQIPSELSIVADAVERRDDGALYRAAHRLKGAASSICATALSASAAEVELLAQAARWLDIPARVLELNRVALRAISAVNMILEERARSH